jgi:hypothetical protein
VIATAASIRSCSSSMLPRAAPNRRRPSPNFSRAWYNGTDYRFDLTALQALGDDLVEHCLAVLRLDHRPAVEVHGYFPGGKQRWQQIIACWNLDKRPALEPAPVHGERYQARYVTNQEAPGYRDITLMVPAARVTRRTTRHEGRRAAAAVAVDSSRTPYAPVVETNVRVPREAYGC